MISTTFNSKIKKMIMHYFYFFQSALIYRICKHKHFLYLPRYLPSCLGQEARKVPFGLRVKLPPAHLSNLTRWRLCSVAPFIDERLVGKLLSIDFNFCSFWFDPTGNQSRVIVSAEQSPLEH